MATGGVLGDGTKVAFSINSPLTWVELTEIVSVEFPSMVADDVSNDVHGSAGFHRSMPGLFDVGDAVVTVLSDFDETTSTNQNTLWGLWQQKTTVWWRIEVPTNRAKTTFTGFEFQAAVAGITAGTPIDDRQTTEYTIRFDGTAFGRDQAGASEI